MNPNLPAAVRRSAFLVLASLVAMPAWAQTYKCTDAQGRVAYQQVPCPGQPVEANQVAVKPVPLLGGKSATPSQPATMTARPSAPPPHADPMASANPQQTMPPSGSGNRGMTWCRERSGQYYPAPPGQSCAGNDTPVADGAPPNFNDYNRVVLPMTRDQERQWYGPDGPPRRPQATLQSRHLSGDSRVACEQARANSKQQYDTNRNLSFSERSALDEQVRDLCD